MKKIFGNLREKKILKDKIVEILKYVLKKIKNGIIRGHQKNTSMEFMGLFANVLTIATYCSISPAIAEYQDIRTLYYISSIAVVIMGFYAIWQLACLIGYDLMRKTLRVFADIQREAVYCLRRSKPARVVLCAAAAVVIVIVFNARKTAYYVSVAEVYGIPQGIGMELSSEEREGRANYWKIEDYLFRKRVRLTYVESYRQLDVMKDYSTVYSMDFFQPSSSIVYTYKKNEDKYRSYGEEVFITARKYGFRDPEKVMYYNSSGKLLLEQRRGTGDKFEIRTYSSKDSPQLFQSTLLRSSEPENVSGVTSRQIETGYNSDGLPESRRISPRINNANGVNGERYAYDENKRLTSLCYLDIDGEPVCNKNGIMLITFQYEENGNLRSIRYFSDEEGTKKTEGYNGVFCEKMNYDTYGNLIERRQLGRDENWRYDNNGIYMYQYSYADGKLKEEAFFGIGNKPIRDKHFHSKAIKYAERKEGLAREIAVTLDTANASESVNEAKSQLSVNKDSMEKAIPVHSINLSTVESDESEDLLESTEDTLAQDVLQEGGDKEHPDEIINHQETEDFTKNIQLNQKEENSADEASIHRKYSSVHYKIKLKNRITEKSYHNKDGDLVANESGYAIQSFRYDSQLHVIM